jgi:PKD repeat protein
MTVGSWDFSSGIMGIQYHTEIKIIDVRINETVAQSVNNSWSTVTDRIDVQASYAFNRNFCSDQRILYVKIPS